MGGMAKPIPPELQGQKYISLASLRKNGTAVRTSVWLAEENGKLYVMTRSDSGKYKRIRNNPEVRIAPSTMRASGKACSSCDHSAITARLSLLGRLKLPKVR